MVDAGQRTVMPVPVDVGNAPGRGAQVARMVPISRERMLGAANADGQGRRSGRSSMTPVGRSPGGLVFLMLLVSLAPWGSATVRCVSCG